MSSIWSRLINLAGNITGVLTVPNGGTGLASGTSGGVPYFSSTTAMTSSALLASNGVLVGGGAGATPASITAGTNGQLLVGVTSGAPAFGSSVSAATTFSGGIVFGAGASNLNNYQTGTNTVAVSGCTTAPNLTVTATRVGNLVNIIVPSVGLLTKSGGGAVTVVAVIPSFARPTSDTYYVTYSGAAGNNGGYVMGSSGTISQYLSTFGSFITANTCGWDADLAFSYVIK